MYIRLTRDIYVNPAYKLKAGTIHNAMETAGSCVLILVDNRWVEIYPVEFEYVDDPISASREIEMEYIDW